MLGMPLAEPSLPSLLRSLTETYLFMPEKTAKDLMEGDGHGGWKCPKDDYVLVRRFMPTKGSVTSRGTGCTKKEVQIGTTVNLVGDGIPADECGGNCVGQFLYQECNVSKS